MANEKPKKKAKPAAPDKNIKCRICLKTIEYERFLSCDLCTEPICVDCTKLTEAVYDYLEDQGIEIPFLCRLCRKEMPKIRNLLQLNQKHEDLKKTVEDLTEKVEKLMEAVPEDFCHEEIKTNTTKINALNRKITKVEEVIQDKKIDDENFPTLAKITSQTKTLNQVLLQQQQIDQKVNKQLEERDEDKRIEAREQNLVIYGIPEQIDDEKEQLKEDFRVIRELYANRVNIMKENIKNLTRLGNKKNGQTRPIRITFTSPDLRLKVLRNNKNLNLYDESFPECKAPFCDNEENHLHIYVSTDKTKQQRDLEKQLRLELRERKLKGETDIILRNYKIVKITKTQSRWVEIINDGF